MLETKRAAQSERYTENHGYEEGKQEYANSVEQRGEVDVLPVELGQGPVCQLVYRVTLRPLHSLVHDDRDSIVQDALSENDRVQFRVDLVGVEDGKDRDGISR